MYALAKSVLAYVRKHDLIGPGDRVGLAVSGGADSVALLRIMLELRDELGVVLSLVHLNHRLRGAESDADEQFVRELAKTHDLEIASENCNVKSFAAEKKLSLEAAARKLRYEFFVRTLQKGDLDHIATAHTLDDQAETVLLKLTRGTGTRGLAGIYPRLSVPHPAPGPQGGKAIVRPLLGTRRAEIEAYLNEIGQSWREDSSNVELRHTRNRIRHEILPRLEAQVNPRVRETVAEAAEIARAEEEFWSEHIHKMLQNVWTRSEYGGRLDWSEVAKLHLALQRRLIRAAGESLELNLEFRHVEAILDLTKGSTDGAGALPGDWAAIFVHRQGQISFEPCEKKLCETAAEYCYELPVPGRIEVPEAGIVVEATLVSAQNPMPGSHECLLRLNNGHALIVRNWRTGDRFWPPHTKEPKRIKELLQNRHITGEKKRLWPVASIEDQIVWVKGFGVRRDFQAENGEGILIRDFPIQR